MFGKLFRRIRKQVELPGYIALGRICEGSMSALFRARSRHDGSIVAIKVLKKSANHTINKLETRYRRMTEGEITCTFSHPNVIKAFEYGRLGDVPYVVLEYVDGVTLAALLHSRSKRLEGKRAKYLHQAAAALEHIHSCGFIHHDFCPKNLLVSADDTVKLFDFGLAVPIGPRPSRRSRVGTAEILAPELLHKEPCDHRIDIFAFGVTAFQVLTGRWPFETAEHMQTLTKILNINPLPPRSYNPDVPEELNELVMRCLRKDPRHRISNMRIVASVFEQYVDVL